MPDATPATKGDIERLQFLLERDREREWRRIEHWMLGELKSYARDDNLASLYRRFEEFVRTTESKEIPTENDMRNVAREEFAGMTKEGSDAQSAVFRYFTLAISFISLLIAIKYAGG
jgi:hypothetical protein